MTHLLPPRRQARTADAMTPLASRPKGKTTARLVCALLAATLTITLAASSTAAVSDQPRRTYVVDTFRDRLGETTFGGAGEPGSRTNRWQTVGQTIRVPARATYLRGFGFRLFFGNRINDIHARAYVYRWNAPGKHAVGDALYRSDVIDIPDQEWQRVHFGTGRLKLQPGRRYVLFLSVAQNRPHQFSRGSYWLSRPGSYTHGRLVVQGGYGTQRWKNHQWQARSDPAADMAFRMRLTN